MSLRQFPKRFSLRALLLAILIAACAVRVFLHYYEIDRRESRAVDLVGEMNGGVEFETRHRISWLPRHRVVAQLQLYKTGAGNTDLSFLADMPDIRRLYLPAEKITDAQMERISQLSNLEELSISRSEVTDNGLRLLARCPHLRVLNINETRINGTVFRELTSLARLETLSAQGIPFDDRDIYEISRLPHLKVLKAGSPKLTDASLRYLSQATTLTMVYLKGNFTREGVRELKKLPLLDEPYIVGADFTIDPIHKVSVPDGSKRRVWYEGIDIWSAEPPDTFDATD